MTQHNALSLVRLLHKAGYLSAEEGLGVGAAQSVVHFLDCGIGVSTFA